MRKVLIGLILLSHWFMLDAQEYYVKTVVFPDGATLEQKVDMAARLVPSKGQYDWQQLELTAFLHFGMNTFTNREWGDGKENPAWFNPTDFDASQWVSVLKEAGFKMVILTAKHHDGFCLWPTKTTTHSVSSSLWKNGKGDVVRELKDACDKQEMKFGVYLSPWDRNALCYGDSPAYNKMFVQQLSELLGNYGTVHEVWFDGANAEGPNGKKQVYDWDMFNAVIDSLQPHAVRAIMGDDVRWVGNEQGLGRETEWSSTVLVPDKYHNAQEENRRMGLYAEAPDLGSRAVLAKARQLFWYPSEVDVSIRPGWFYHADQDLQVKSLAHLVDIYFKSVGYNSVLLLNVPPDTRGRISDSDAARLKQFGLYLRNTFADNYLLNADRKKEIRAGKSVEYAIIPGKVVNTFLIQEDICKGQRVESFVLEARFGGKWQKIAEGTTIGYKRLFRFKDCQPEKLRLTINECRLPVQILRAGVYNAPGIFDLGDADDMGDLLQVSWKTTGLNQESDLVVVEMETEADIVGFIYMPIPERDKKYLAFTYRFYVSKDGQNWTKCHCPGEFSNIENNPVRQVVRFGQKYRGRYFKIESESITGGKPYITLDQLGILTK